jgi:hypothetical protein
VLVYLLVDSERSINLMVIKDAFYRESLL